VEEKEKAGSLRDMIVPIGKFCWAIPETESIRIKVNQNFSFYLLTSIGRIGCFVM